MVVPIPSCRMKISIRSLLSFVALAALMSAPASAKEFEGKVTFQNTVGKKLTTRLNYMKGGMIRVETIAPAPEAESAKAESAKAVKPKRRARGGEGDGPGVMILNVPAKQSITLMPEQKQYMVMEFDPAKLAATAKDMVNATEPVKTGRSEKICGYSCDEYTMTANNDTIQMWIAEGFGTAAFFSSGGGRGGSQPSAWENIAREKGWFSLRNVTLDKKGVEKSRLEATAVEKGHLDDELFKPPADYTEFKMPSISGLGDFLKGH